MSCAVILCAAVFVMSIAARVYLTQLSDESAELSTLLQELAIEKRLVLAESEELSSPDALHKKAAENNMLSPGDAEYIFIQPPEKDITVYHEAYQTKLDKPDTIWEYFG